MTVIRNPIRWTGPCEHCGNEFSKPANAVRAHNFCSRTCYTSSDYRSGLMRQRMAESYPDAKVTRPCAYCGKPVTRARSKTAKQFFCDRDCHHAYKRSLGTRQINPGGYAVVFVGKGQPGASKSGHILEHRKVMQEMLGRPLLPEENVHHKNGIRTDNRPENLELWSRSQPSGQRVADKIKWAEEILALYAALPKELRD